MIISFITVLLLIACNESFSSNISEKTESKYTSKEYFKGVILGYGAVAEEIPEINDYMKMSIYITDEKEYKELKDYNDAVVELIAKDNPSFFNQFKDDIESGNHIIVQRAIKNAGKLFIKGQSSIVSKYGSSTDKSSNVVKIIGVIQLVFPPPPIRHFINFINVYNDAPSTFFTKFKDPKFNNLLKDQVINSITEKF